MKHLHRPYPMVLTASCPFANIFPSLPSLTSVQNLLFRLAFVARGKKVGIKVRASSSHFDHTSYFIGFFKRLSIFPS